MARSLLVWDLREICRTFPLCRGFRYSEIRYSEVRLYFDEEDPGSALRAPMAPWSLNEIRERCTRTRVRVMAHCTDLLEVSPISMDGELAASRVDFLHRTVHEFLQTRNIHSLLTERAGATFNTHLFMCNSTLSQIKRLELRYKSHDKRFVMEFDGGQKCWDSANQRPFSPQAD